MYTINDAPIFQLIFGLLKDYHTLRGKFLKTEKYTLGEKTEDALLAVLIAVVEAGHAKKEWKISHIETALAKTELAKILFRLTLELKSMNEKQYLNVQSRLQRTAQMRHKVHKRVPKTPLFC
ncbi:MAG: four helix bundle protein [Patescibacteria group bacterium]